MSGDAYAGGSSRAELNDANDRDFNSYGNGPRFRGPFAAGGGETVSAFPLARNLLGVEGEIIDYEVRALPTALDDVAALTIPLVALGVEDGERVPLAGRTDAVVVQAGLAADVVESLHLEPPIKGTLT